MVATPPAYRFEIPIRGGGEAGAGDCGTLAQAQAGDTRAFAQLVRAYQRSVYSVALRALGSPAEAEDLAQEVFLQLHLGLARIESPDHLAHWLRRTVSHRAIDRLRQRRRSPEVEDIAALEPAPAVDSTSAPDRQDPALARRLGRLVAELPAIPRLVVVLRYQEDLDPAEIARALDLSVNTVKSHLRRSLARLRARYTE
ncbi:MAG: sigma-70 family RNA polymerase sigma factor [Steroidobacteraceae bacterium]